MDINNKSDIKPSTNIYLFFSAVILLISLYFFSSLPVSNEDTIFKKTISFIEKNPNCENVRKEVKDSLVDNSISIKESNLINWQINDCVQNHNHQIENNKNIDPHGKEILLLKIKKLSNN